MDFFKTHIIQTLFTLVRLKSAVHVYKVNGYNEAEKRSET